MHRSFGPQTVGLRMTTKSSTPSLLPAAPAPTSTTKNNLGADSSVRATRLQGTNKVIASGTIEISAGRVPTNSPSASTRIAVARCRQVTRLLSRSEERRVGKEGRDRGARGRERDK